MFRRNDFPDLITPVIDTTNTGRSFGLIFFMTASNTDTSNLSGSLSILSGMSIILSGFADEIHPNTVYKLLKSKKT